MLSLGAHAWLVSACPYLIWCHYNQPDTRRAIEHVNMIDGMIRASFLEGQNDVDNKSSIEVRSGVIDGFMSFKGVGRKMLYVAVSYDSVPLDWQLLHAQNLMHDLKAEKPRYAVDSAFLVTLNKMTGGYSRAVLKYDPAFSIDFCAVAENNMPGRQVVNDACGICPKRFECDTYERMETEPGGF